jgi:GT2 family glycosyltransferase
MTADAAIAYVHGSMVHAPFMASVVGAIRLGRYSVLARMSGPNISVSRNMLVEDFLATDRTWLFMVDTDVVFKPDAIERLVDGGHSIVSGLIYVDDDPPFPMAYRRLADLAVGMPLFMAVRELVVDGSCVEVDAVGAGCLLVHRDVYRDIETKMPYRAAQWFQETAIGPNLIGEDMSFCDRAAQLGHSIWVDTNVRMGHMKQHMIGKVL